MNDLKKVYSQLEQTPDDIATKDYLATIESAVTASGINIHMETEQLQKELSVIRMKIMA